MATPRPLPIDIGQWRQAGYDVLIEKFVATAVKMTNEDSFNPDDPSQRLIHWRGAGAYRVAHDVHPGFRWASTSFDTQKVSREDATVEVQFITKAFDISRTAVAFWEVPLIRNYTARNVFDLVVAKKLHQYVYNGSGSGCLTWTTRLIEVLEAERVLPAGSKEDFLKVVDSVRANPVCWVPKEDGANFYE